MKQLLTLLVLLVAVTSCSAQTKVKQTNTYILFELDSAAHTTTTAWATKIVTDSLVGRQHVLDSAYYIYWPAEVRDTLRNAQGTLYTSEPQRRMVLTNLRAGAVIMELGLPREKRKP